ncbi:AAA family ATPase [Intestinimonas timonensis]|uniref:AAA family ATPase n=1 Tax=Intestinimonas timonensis TaxID=1689270 RepID=UPI0032C485B0
MAAFKNKDNGTWYVQFRYTDWKGERQQKLKRGFATKREALEWEREFLMEKQADVNMTFESFVALYERDIKPKLKLNTWLTKESIIKKKILPYFATVTLDELMDNVFEGKSAVIENLLYTGAYILAGAPKIGKSFLVAQIAHHISTGQDLWGYKTHQGTVLYLALEDDESRLQRRMFRMFGVEGTSSLHFATNAKMIGGGLDEQLEKFVREHSDTKLIIVDTLQKVREAVSDSYSYSSDYEVIGKLKQFADRYGVCVLIVHHTRKQPAGDSFEMISGTTGLLGCADGALLMQKEKRTDTLPCSLCLTFGGGGLPSCPNPLHDI